MKVLDRVPCLAGSALQDGTLIVPRRLGDDPNVQPRGVVGAGGHVADVEASRTTVLYDVTMQPLEGLFAQRSVDLAPVDFGLGTRLLDKVLVAGGSTCVRRGEADDRAVSGTEAVAGAEGVVVKLLDREVPELIAGVSESMPIQPDSTGTMAVDCQPSFPVANRSGGTGVTASARTPKNPSVTIRPPCRKRVRRRAYKMI
jgi:hypothetical protein